MSEVLDWPERWSNVRLVGSIPKESLTAFRAFHDHHLAFGAISRVDLP
jgi:hypothetical protein